VEQRFHGAFLGRVAPARDAELLWASRFLDVTDYRIRHLAIFGEARDLYPADDGVAEDAL
jgi:hypothetical protein